MSITFRPYVDPDDYHLVDDFLIRHYQPGNLDGNWLQPAWEYMYGQPFLDWRKLNKIGLWLEAGELVAVTHFESGLGEAFFQFHPDYRCLAPEMLEYAEQELAATLLGKKSLQIYVNELDEDFLELVKARGYFVDDYEDRRLYGLRLPGPVSALQLPQGFRLTSLAEEYNWEKKLHRVLWRGFDYPGEPTYDEDEVEDDRLMFDTPTVRWDLKIAVAAPDGEFVSICGMWFEPVNRFAYIDPVATDPDYRHLHLEKAAVLEGLRRCTALGATMAYVESDEKFYRTLGFREVTHYECWKKYLDEAEKPAPLETSQTPEAETSQPKLDQQQIQRLSLIKLHWGTAHNTPPDKDLNYPN